MFLYLEFLMMIIVHKDKDFFLTVASKESESDSEYNFNSEEWEKEYKERQKKARALEKKWEEGGKEGECAFTPDCEVVSSSLFMKVIFHHRRIYLLFSS